MKRKLMTLCAAALLMSSVSMAQSVVRLQPSTSQGFLLLNNTDFPTVTTWEVNLMKTTFSGGVGTTTQERQDILSGSKNYTHFDEEYYDQSDPNTEYSYIINGYDNTNTPVTSTDPQRLCYDCPPHNFTEVKAWTCQGKRYAWTVKLWENMSSGDFYLYFNQGVDHFSTQNGGYAIPYYEWGNLTWKDIICGSQILKDYYGVTSNDCYSIGNQSSSEKIIRRSAVTGDYLRDMNCLAIAGEIFGIQKYLGDWRDRAGMLVNIGTSNLSGLTRSELITEINDSGWFGFSLFGDDEDLLKCESCGVGPTWTAGGWWGSDFRKAPWHKEFPNTDSPDPDEDNGIWGLVGTMSGYVGGTTIKINDKVDWHSNLREVRISRVNESATGVRIVRDELFNKAGQFSYPSLQFEPGLYVIEFIHQDQTGLPLFYEVKQQETFTMKNKDQFEVTIYPVPIVGNSFDMDMKASAKMTVTYKLFGPSSQQLHSESFSMSKGQTLTETIGSNTLAAVAAWPTGIYTHRFTFGDGSVKTFTSVKP